MRISTPVRLLFLLAVSLAAACAPTPPTTVSDTASLDQTFTSGDGTLTFRYPAGWVIREADEQIFLGTNAEALESSANSVPASPGQFAAGVIVLPTASVPGLGAQAGPLDVVSAFSSFLSGASEAAGDDNPPILGDPTAITIGNRRAARIEGTSGADQALLIALELEPGVFAILAGGSAAGELSRFEPTLLAIAETIEYSSTPPVSTPPAASPETTATEEAGN
jgi:hypothetical protein